MFFCVQYLCSNMTVTEDNTCGLVIVSLVSALPSIAFLQVFNCNCFFQVLLVNQSLFSSSHAQSIAFSTQAPWSPAQLSAFFSDCKTNIKKWQPHRAHDQIPIFQQEQIRNIFSNAIVKVKQCKCESTKGKRGAITLRQVRSSNHLLRGLWSISGNCGGGRKPLGESDIPFIRPYIF